MARSTRIVLVSAAAGVAALGAGVGFAGIASADPTSTPSASPTATASTPSGSSTTSPSTGTGSTDQDGRRGGHGRGMQNADLAKQLAEKLGVDEAKVTEALQAIREENRPSSTASPSTSPSTGSTTSPSATPSTDPSTGATTSPSRPDRSERQAELAKQLAEKLGIDEAKVTKALEEIQAERDAERAAALQTGLDDAVKAGTLTQAEADAVKKAVEKGVIGGR